MKYGLIYADPPWQYRDKCNAGNRGACHKYSVMDLEAIKALPIADLAADDADFAAGLEGHGVKAGLRTAELEGAFHTAAGGGQAISFIQL